MKTFLVVLAILGFASAQQQWVTLEKDLETIIIGISFVNETYGWIPGDQNGVGALFLRSIDGGNTWKPCTHEGYVTIPMGIAVELTSAGTFSGVISGVGVGRNFSSMEYTADGQNWHAPTPNPNFVGESQDAKAIKGLDNAFALAGIYTSNAGKTFNGATVSYDGGMTWSDVDIGYDFPYARYGSFPTPTTWFITAGVWPELDQWDGDEEAKVLSSKLRIHKRHGVQFKHKLMEAEAQPTTATSRRLLQTGGYMASISRTTDGGKTFTTVYNDTTGSFYFNDIACANAQICWAVGESESDSPNPGVRVIGTTDGGATWQVQLYVNNPEYSFFDVGAVSTTEAWAVGGILARSITGIFYHTVDGGKTWTLEEQLSDEYATALSFVPSASAPSGYLGWATALTLEGQSSVLAYK